MLDKSRVNAYDGSRSIGSVKKLLRVESCTDKRGVTLSPFASHSTITIQRDNMKPTTTLQSVWNSAVYAEPHDPEPRDYLWASELGKSPVDLYLKLKGIPYSNPPNMRSLRKFDMGNTHEFIIDTVLQRCGLLVESQKRVRYQYDGMLMVSGRLDQIMGGSVDYEQAMHEIDKLHLPEHYLHKARSLVQHFSENYPEGFKEVILETKSTSSFMFDVYDRKREASDNHRMQLFHYLKALDYDLGHIAYISRDDGRMLVLGVSNPGRDEELYKKHIKIISDYYQANEQPPLEEPIIFDDTLLKFRDNWKIKYSNYLTLLYGFKSQMHYENEFKPMVSRFNRVIKRIAEGKNMTDNNKQAIEEMKIHYPDFEKHIPDIKQRLSEEDKLKKQASIEARQVEAENVKRAQDIWNKHKSKIQLMRDDDLFEYGEEGDDN